MAPPADHDVRMRRARLALDGLSVGDAFGERFYVVPGSLDAVIEARRMPPGPWAYTDDTIMALSIVEALERDGAIDKDQLASAFVARYLNDPGRGYGQLAHFVLASISGGLSWSEAAASVFEGEGSKGNGAAMRAAPIGAYFADDLDTAAREARASAEPTHAHADGQAGAVAVAVSAAIAARMGEHRATRSGKDLLETAHALTPDGPTREGIARARSLFADRASITHAARVLGAGELLLSSDTVPFALYAGAVGLGNVADTLWSTIAGGGDLDTTCAIAGSIAALSAGSVPAEWIAQREPLS
jgi:ADP-ribosylglycohydrolase